jgi:hypothetical protein
MKKISTLSKHISQHINTDTLARLALESNSDLEIKRLMDKAFTNLSLEPILFDILSYSATVEGDSKINNLGSDLDGQIRKNTLILHEDDYCHISIGIKKTHNNNIKNNSYDFIEVLKREESNISSSPNAQFVHIIDGEMHYKKFTFEDLSSSPKQSLLSNLKLKSVGEGLLKKGDCIKVGADENVVKLSSEKYTFYAIFRKKEMSPYQVLFNNKLDAVQLADTDKKMTRIKMNLKFLKHLNKSSEQIKEAIKKAFEHPAHTVRWEAIKTANALDSSLAKELIHQGMKDPHIEIAQICTNLINTNKAA